MLYIEQSNLAKQAKAALAELDEATSKDAGTSKKSSKKPKEGAATADAPDPKLHAIYQQDIEKAKEESTRKSALRSIATSARSMGACILHIT